MSSERNEFDLDLAPTRRDREKASGWPKKIKNSRLNAAIKKERSLATWLEFSLQSLCTAFIQLQTTIDVHPPSVMNL